MSSKLNERPTQGEHAHSLHERLDDICAQNGWRQLTLEQKHRVERVREYCLRYPPSDELTSMPLTDGQRAAIRAACR
jgi:hypothetical protein